MKIEIKRMVLGPVQTNVYYVINPETKECVILDPADNAKLCTMAGNFAPKVQFGAAWWFNDHIRGIRKQLDELMETGALASSVGMLTDSRSFTSFVRHEYYRRILCRKLGRLVDRGLYPPDETALGALTAAVCYENAAAFFDRGA